ncbi:DDE superfamily endonuclease [Popillia japonica]|uniref:DDE superfamily endonuclease n=1 Tax=Popillia japonica TaxID=7064 RepID=A0AAW1IUK0_POPJA
MVDFIVNAIKKLEVDKRLHSISIKERVILTMMKLKQNSSYAMLGCLFGINSNLCRSYILAFLPLIASVVRPMIYFPTTEEIKNNMPKCFEKFEDVRIIIDCTEIHIQKPKCLCCSFEKFEDVRIIIDCTEIHIQKPKCLCCRICFYSHYKGCETVKFMVGCSPGGIITFVSEPYGGRLSDKFIFEESDLILALERDKDAIMVDKGFLIDDVCSSFGIKLIRPPFIKNKNQLSVEEAALNAQIAAARVHIERLNQRIKIFQVLGSKLQWSLVQYINSIFVIACGITNLSAPILNDERFLSNLNL